MLALDILRRNSLRLADPPGKTSFDNASSFFSNRSISNGFEQIVLR
jgi:hypothetical protein